jgi:preprotein translocase subunit SecB
VSMTNGGPEAAFPGNKPGPELSVLAQYIKDFSFENPNAPQSMTSNEQPQISIQVNVGANPVTGSDTDIEVSVKLEGKAEIGAKLLFHFELDFAGIFRIRNIPQESMSAVVLIECPRLLFPFAREIIATTVRNGGFPPLLLEPIDFVALYRQKMAQMQPAEGTTAQ